MYSNLNMELEKKGVKKEQLSHLFDNNITTVTEKLNGESEIVLEEAIKIRDTYFPYYSLEYLFDKEM